MKRSDGGWLVRGVCIALLAAPAIAANACVTGDQICYQDSRADDLDDDCPYGPKGGPKVQQTADDTGCGDLPDFTMPGTCPSWAEVWVRLTAGDGGRCANAGCHTGAGVGANLTLPADLPDKAYDALSKYERDGAPYLRPKGEKGAEKAWILCNVQALQGAHSPMPKPGGLTGTTKAADVALIRDWVNCGMQLLGGGTGGGGVGGGGIGGAGGGGGVGGI